MIALPVLVTVNCTVPYLYLTAPLWWLTAVLGATGCGVVGVVGLGATVLGFGADVVGLVVGLVVGEVGPGVGVTPGSVGVGLGVTGVGTKMDEGLAVAPISMPTATETRDKAPITA